MLTVRAPTPEEAQRYRKAHLDQAGFCLFVAAFWLVMGTLSVAFHRSGPWMPYFELAMAVCMVPLALRERKAARQYDVS